MAPGGEGRWYIVAKEPPILSYTQKNTCKYGHSKEIGLRCKSCKKITDDRGWPNRGWRRMKKEIAKRIARKELLIAQLEKDLLDVTEN